MPTSKPKAPWWLLVVIGAMNGTGNFCAAIGQPHTRGDTQVGRNSVVLALAARPRAYMPLQYAVPRYGKSPLSLFQTYGWRKHRLPAVGVREQELPSPTHSSHSHLPICWQALILLMGVPMVMFLSWIFLRQRPSFLAFYAACFIVAGVVISSLPSLLGENTDTSVVTLWCVAGNG